ncbi:MAG: AMP-binding protein, partial [Bifidobacterium psychraerophilum]|uniref:AMP-dependent synthetase/ligase n=1 Tax=Bifidobacterium psychraerophilum TaxID=218140 RepID=UPI0039E817FE
MFKEYSRPLNQAIEDDRNIFSVLQERADRAPDDTLIEYKTLRNGWGAFTALEFRNTVVALAKGLIARGIMPGDSVSIISHTRWEWTALDMAIMSIGALTVPVYETNSSAQVRMIFNDAKVTMAFAETDEQRDKIESVRDQCAYLNDVYVIDLGALDALTAYGRGVSDEEFMEREQGVKGSDLATIVYTSGSTGTPKGIELSHSNFVFVTHSGVQTMPDISLKPNRRLLLFLPLAHVFARYMQFFCFAGNITLGLSSNLKTILADFHAFKPTFILAVPRIFEKIFNASSQRAGKGVKGRIFLQAAKTAREWSVYQQEGRHMPLSFRLRHAFYDKLIYSSIMEVFGGSVEYAISGGAPLDTSIAHFFNGVGLPLLEGYGMTETSAPATVH